MGYLIPGAIVAAVLGTGYWYNNRAKRIADVRGAIDKFMAADEGNMKGTAGQPFTGSDREKMLDSLTLIYLGKSLQQVQFASAQLKSRGYIMTGQSFDLQAHNLGAPNDAVYQAALDPSKKVAPPIMSPSGLAAAKKH
jgi:hypothetical protein